MKTALILAGAVAKGAFEAGVLAVLQERGIELEALVAASAGSLNAALYATGVRFNRTRLAAETLLSLWREHAGWSDIVQPTLRGVLEHTGVSKTDALQKLLFEGMQQVSGGEPPVGGARAVRLQLVTTNLNGATRSEGEIHATTFEHVSSLRMPTSTAPRAGSASRRQRSLPRLFRSCSYRSCSRGWGPASTAAP